MKLFCKINLCNDVLNAHAVLNLPTAVRQMCMRRPKKKYTFPLLVFGSSPLLLPSRALTKRKRTVHIAF